ncbi:NUDIX domain-containing protein [Nocardia mangyaensis]|uniref:NUDIX domain-containing protein n=1 Tax=Nocardia mangyaensis TaxID=2213200 RepID=UPI002675D4BD|nr:NUDIX domain-containing protein [Nocardia mangyaensis]MDO3651141.1 NUDIX domain-containing protein [Nocardia mangyaensis]
MTPCHLVDVHVLLIRQDRILLSLRRSGDKYDHRWHLPSGKLEVGESAASGAAREAAEEVGVTIDPAVLRLIHVAHVTAPGHDARLGLFFRTEHWVGEPVNREPDKCYELRWFPLAALPTDLIEYSALGIAALTTPTPYSELGWPYLDR